jgi:hypothetical protein
VQQQSKIKIELQMTGFTPNNVSVNAGNLHVAKPQIAGL